MIFQNPIACSVQLISRWETVKSFASFAFTQIKMCRCDRDRKLRSCQPSASVPTANATLLHSRVCKTSLDGLQCRVLPLSCLCFEFRRPPRDVLWAPTATPATPKATPKAACSRNRNINRNRNRRRRWHGATCVCCPVSTERGMGLHTHPHTG